MAKLGTDAIIAGTYASIPSAALAGRLYWATDTKRLYRDSGTAWVELGYTQGARVYHSANQSIPNSSNTVLAFDTELYDTDTIHDVSTNNSRLTCKTAGIYLISAAIVFGYSSASNKRHICFLKLNNTTQIGRAEEVSTGGYPCPVAVATYQLAVNDYVEAIAYQDTGGALDALCASIDLTSFMMQRIG